MPRAKTKKLPKGLLEFEGSLHDLEYAGRLLPRLRDLPESSFTDDLAAFDKAMRDVEEAEELARQCRKRAREVALRAWAKAVKNWTVKELQEATGYDHE